VRFSFDIAASRNASGSQHQQVVWAVCDFTECQSTFGLFGMQNAPSIAYFPPTSRRSRWSAASAPLPEGTSLQPQEPQSPNDILRIMQLPASVTIMRPAVEHRALSVLAALMVASFAVWVGGDRRKLRVWQVPAVWRAGSLLLVGVAVSGLVFCIIRQPPMLGMDDKGKPTLFSTGGREQYVAEGLWVGALTLAAAVAVIVLVNTAKQGRGDITNIVYGLVLSLVAAALLLRLLQLYQFKTSWYSPISSLPPGWQGNLQTFGKWLESPRVSFSALSVLAGQLKRTALAVQAQMQQLLQ
jgi:magnesium transporter 1